MCDLTEVDYQKGDVVWVKLGSLWWPGLVHDYDSLPEDIKADTQAFKKQPIAFVKFFQEDNFEYVKDIHSIYQYNCLKKNEFIKKGLDMMRSSRVSTSNMQLFPGDVITAENLTQGDPKILERPEFQEEVEAGKVVYEDLFATPNQKKLKKKKDVKDSSPLVGGFFKTEPRRKSMLSKSSKNTPKLISQDRLLDLSAEAAAKGYKSMDMIQDPEEDADFMKKNYLCPKCSYECTRINVMLYHHQEHIRNYEHKVKYPPGFKRKKRSGNTATGGSAKKIKLTNGVEDGGRKVKTKADVLEQQKLDAEKLKQNFLMDWNEDDNDDVDEDLDVSVETTTTKEEDKTSCFDFDDEEDNATCSNNISFTNRKRLYSKSEDKKSLTNGKDSKPELLDEVEALLNETQVPALPNVPSAKKGGDAITLPAPSEDLPEFGTLNNDLNDTVEFRNEVQLKSSTPLNLNPTSSKLSKETLKTNFFKKFREEIAEEAKFKEDEEDGRDEEIDDEENCDVNEIELNKKEKSVPSTEHEAKDVSESNEDNPKEIVEKEVDSILNEVEMQADKDQIEEKDFHEQKAILIDKDKVKEQNVQQNETEKQPDTVVDTVKVNKVVKSVTKEHTFEKNEPTNESEVPNSKLTLSNTQDSKLQVSPGKLENKPITKSDTITKQNTPSSKTQDTLQPTKQEKVTSLNVNKTPSQGTTPIKQLQVPSQIITPNKKQEIVNTKQDIVGNKTQSRPIQIEKKPAEKMTENQGSVVKIGNQTIHIPVRRNSKTEARRPEDKSKTEEDRLSEMMLVVEEVDLSQNPSKNVGKPPQPVLHIDMSPKEKKSFPLSKQSTLEKRGSLKSVPTIIPIETVRPKYKPINIPSTRQTVTPSKPQAKPTEEQYFILPNNQRIRTPTPSPTKTQTKITLSSPDAGKISKSEKQVSHHQSQVVLVSESTKQNASNVPLITLKSTQKKPNLPVPGLMKIKASQATSPAVSKQSKSKAQSSLQSKIKTIAHSNATRVDTGPGSILVNQSTLPSILQQRRSTQPRGHPPALVPTPKLVAEPELLSEITSIPGADSSNSVVYLINSEHSQQLLLSSPGPAPPPESQTYYLDPSAADLSNIYLTIDDDGNILNIVQKTEQGAGAPGPRSDILAQALADTQVLQAESAVVGPSDNYSPLVNNTYETSLTLNQAPIMSTSEAPSHVQQNYYTTSTSALPLGELRPNQTRGASPEVAYTPSDNFVPT